jgi:hypothetical protein
MARKHVAKKLKVTETTSREVSHLEEGSQVLMKVLSLCVDDEVSLLAGDATFRAR